MGFCIWITGFSGAGKTSTAKSLISRLNDRGEAAINLDGDEVRAAFGLNKYDSESRCAYTIGYLNLAKLLNASGANVVISAVGMFPVAFEKFWRELNQPVLVFLDLDASALVKTGKSFDPLFNGYEPPERCSLHLKRREFETPDLVAEKIIYHLEELGLV